MHEILSDRCTWIRRNILKWCWITCCRCNDYRVVHGIIFVQVIYNLGYCWSLLAYSHIYTDDILALLIQNGIYRYGCLTCLSVSYDQLSLSSSDWEHGIYREDSCLKRLVDRLTINYAWSRILYWTIIRWLYAALSIYRCSKGINYTSDKCIAYRDACTLSRSADLCSFFDSCITTEQNTSYLCSSDILNHTFDTILKNNDLAVHGIVYTVYGHDSITYIDDLTDFFVPGVKIIILYLFFEYRNNILWTNWTQFITS